MFDKSVGRVTTLIMHIALSVNYYEILRLHTDVVSFDFPFEQSAATTGRVRGKSVGMS